MIMHMKKKTYPGRGMDTLLFYEEAILCFIVCFHVHIITSEATLKKMKLLHKGQIISLQIRALLASEIKHF